MTRLLYRHGPDDPGDDPPLPLAQGPALDDRNAVAYLRGVLLVVCDELRRPALGLAVEAVPHLPLDRNDARLLHLVADDNAFFFSLLSHRLSFLQLPRGPTPAACTSRPGSLGGTCRACPL